MVFKCGKWQKRTALFGCWLASPRALRSLPLEGVRGSGPCSRWAGYSQPMFNMLGGSEAMPASCSNEVTRLQQ